MCLDKTLTSAKIYVSNNPRAPLVSVKRKMTLPNVKQLQSDILSVYKTMMFYPNESDESYLEVFRTHLGPELEESLISEIREKVILKSYMVMKISPKHMSTNEEIVEIQSYFWCQYFPELIEDTIKQHVEEGFLKITKSCEELIHRCSGWKPKTF